MDTTLTALETKKENNALTFTVPTTTPGGVEAVVPGVVKHRINGITQSVYKNINNTTNIKNDY
jgi:hypothetical protein